MRFYQPGQKLWGRAKRIILVEICCYPSGQRCIFQTTGLVILKASSCFVWDLDDNQLIDMSIMSVGTNSSYSHPESTNPLYLQFMQVP